MKMEQTRDLIGEVAFTLFREKGFSATTVEEIAAAAGVGARTVYRHFPTKEMLALSCFAAMFETALDELQSCPEDTPVPDALYVILDSTMRSHLQRPDQFLIMYRMARDTPSVQAQQTYLIHEWQLKLNDEIAYRIGRRSAGLAAELAVAQTASVIILAVRKWSASDGQADLEKLASEALELLRSGQVPISARMR